MGRDRIALEYWGTRPDGRQHINMNLASIILLWRSAAVEPVKATILVVSCSIKPSDVGM
jgi:hypothetical protein